MTEEVYPRAAVEADWTSTDPCHLRGQDVYQQYAIINEVHALWQSAITNDQVMPDEILGGLYLGDENEIKKFRLLVVSGTGAFSISHNTGTDAVPVWVEDFVISSAGVVTVSLSHSNLTNLGADDHTQYSRVDGTRAFTSTVAGVTPVAAADLSTKFYVDNAIGAVQRALVSADAAKLVITSGSSSITFDPAAMPLTTSVVLRDGSQSFTGNQSLGGFNLTNVGSLAAVSGSYSTSLTTSGLRVLTTDDLDLFSAVASGTEVAYFSDATDLTIVHALNSSDVMVQVLNSNNDVITPNIMRPLSASEYFLQFASPTTGRALLVALTQRVLGAGNQAFLHTQSVASATWSIAHNLTSVNPGVWIYDTTGTLIEPDNIVVVDNANLSITFNEAKDGTATVLKIGAAVSVAGGGGGGGGVTVHSDLTGLSADDHTQYILVNGTRSFTGNISHGGFNLSNVGTIGATTGTFTTSLTISGVPVVTSVNSGVTALTASGINSTAGAINFVGTRGANVSLGGGTLTIDAVPPIDNPDIDAVTVSGGAQTTGVINFVGSRAGNVSRSGNTLTFDAPPAGTGAGGSGITALVQDTSPQLGGNLSTTGFNITDAGSLTISTIGDLNLDAIGDLNLDAIFEITISSASSTIILDTPLGSVTVGGFSNRVDTKNVAKVVACFSSAGGSVTEHTAHNFNVSSISRTSAGKYRINFSGGFLDANYGFAASAKPTSAGNVVVVIEDIAASGRQTGSIDIAVLQNGVIADSDKICVTCWGKLS